jgi:hypothetical protein
MDNSPKPAPMMGTPGHCGDVVVAPEPPLWANRYQWAYTASTVNCCCSLKRCG